VAALRQEVKDQVCSLLPAYLARHRSADSYPCSAAGCRHASLDGHLRRHHANRGADARAPEWIMYLDLQPPPHAPAVDGLGRCSCARAQDTHDLLKQQSERHAADLLSQIEEVAVELSDLEERSQKFCSQACDEVARHCQEEIQSMAQRLAAAPWQTEISAVVRRLEQSVMPQLQRVESAQQGTDARLEEQSALLSHTQQAQEHTTDVVNTLASELDIGVKAAIADLRQELQQHSAAVQEACREDARRLGGAVTQLDAKVDDAVLRLAERMDARAEALERQSAEAAKASDDALQKLAKASTGTQNADRAAAMESANQIRAELSGLGGDVGSLSVKVAAVDAAGQHNFEHLQKQLHSKIEQTDGRIEQLVQDIEKGLSELRAAVDAIKQEASEGGSRIDGISAAVGDLGRDIAACGRDVSQSIQDVAQCQQRVQHFSMQFDEKLSQVDSDVQKLSTSTAGQLSAIVDGAEADKVIVERRDQQINEQIYGLQSTLDHHIQAADRHQSAVATRMDESDQAFRSADSELRVALDSLSDLHRESSNANALRFEQIDKALKDQLAQSQADLRREAADYSREHGDRVKSVDTQLRELLEELRKAMEQGIARAIATGDERAVRFEQEVDTRFDNARNTVEQQMATSERQQESQVAQLDADIRGQIDRSVATVERQIADQGADHNAQIQKLGSDNRIDLQKLRASLENMVNDSSAAQEKTVRSLEAAVQEHVQRLKLDAQRAQTETQGSLSRMAELNEQRISDHAHAQIAAFEKLQSSTTRTIEEKTSKTEQVCSNMEKASTDRHATLATELRTVQSGLQAEIQELTKQEMSRSKALESALEANVDILRTELRTQIAEQAAQTSTKFGTLETELGDRIHDTDVAAASRLENASVSLKRHALEMTATSETAFRKSHADLVADIEAKFTSLTQDIKKTQLTQEDQNAQLSSTLGKSIEKTRLSLQEMLTKANEFSDQRFKRTYEDTRAQIAVVQSEMGQKLTNIETQHSELSVKLEKSVEKLVEDTCSALDEHWTDRLSEQTQRIADFESAVVSSVDATAENLKQQFDSAHAQQQARHDALASRATDLIEAVFPELQQRLADHTSQCDARYSSLQAEAAATTDRLSSSVQQLSAQQQEFAAAQESQMNVLDQKIQESIQVTGAEAAKQIADSRSEHEARTREISQLLEAQESRQAQYMQSSDKITTDLRNENGVVRAEFTRQVEEQRGLIDSIAETMESIAKQADSQLAKVYTDMDSTVQRAQLTVEEQLNASIAAQSRRLSEVDGTVSDATRRLDTVLTSCQDSIAQLQNHVAAEHGAMQEAFDRHVNQSNADLSAKIAEVEALTNTNLSRATEHAAALESVTAELNHTINEHVGALSAKVDDNHAAMGNLQAHVQNIDSNTSEQVEAVRSTLERQLNQSAAAYNEHFTLLEEITREQRKQLGKQDSAIADATAAVNQNIAAVAALEQRLAQMAAETERRSSSNATSESDLSARLATTQQAMGTLSDEMRITSQTVAEDRQRVADLEASMNITIARHNEANMLLEQLDTALPMLRSQLDEHVLSVEQLAQATGTKLSSGVEAQVEQVKIAVSSMQGPQELQERRISEVEAILTSQATETQAVEHEVSRLRDVVGRSAEELAALQAASATSAADDRLTRVESRSDQIKGTMGRCLEMLARLRQESQGLDGRLSSLENRV
jgi:chromosome segregation ATPase